jgi:xylan 1,4-beta-xylosidase
VVQRADGGYRGVLWNADLHYSGASLELKMVFPAADGDYCLITKTMDEECCNPLKLWHDMGEPSHLSLEQKATLKEHAVPLLLSKSVAATDSNIEIAFSLKPNAVVYFELAGVRRKSDRGYSYERLAGGEK